MEFSVKSGSPEKQRSACIVVGVFEPRRLSPIAEQRMECYITENSSEYMRMRWITKFRKCSRFPCMCWLTISI